MRLSKQLTADGSHTLYVPEIDEHYHSVNGAVQESMHVFIEAGFLHLQKEKARIWEVGFGTGLNAFLTLLEAEKTGIDTAYFAIELHPLSAAFAETLNYGEGAGEEGKALFTALHTAAWGTPIALTRHFVLHKILGDATCTEPPGVFDLIYFDAFAPDKQSEMWSQALFDTLYAHTAEGGILTTYCAKGVVRRRMQASGYCVERLPGPAGKREMLRAVVCT